MSQVNTDGENQPFEALAQAIALASGTLAKAIPEGADTDKLIAQAAGVDGAGAAAGSAEGEGNGAGEGEGNGADGRSVVDSGRGEDGELLNKALPGAMTVFDASGQPMDAIDATDMLKALGETVESIQSARAVENTHLGAALGLMHNMVKSQHELIASQGTLIKSLQEQVAVIGDSGRGRKAVVNVLDKSGATVEGQIAKALPEGLTGEAFLGKCLTAQKEGKLTGIDVAVAESCLTRGLAVPADIVGKVAGV